VKIFSKKMSMEEFAFAIASALDERGIKVILTGGAVVSIYSEGKYVSKDLDFLSPDDHQKIKKAMSGLGFKNEGKDFFHEDSLFSVEFPGYELVIGDEAMRPEGKLKKGRFTLRLLSPTQCVMDRLAAFYHWKDRQSLEQALLVAKAQPIKLNKVREWSKNEGMLDRYEIFLNALNAG
jgi:hypothetical protein